MLNPGGGKIRFLNKIVLVIGALGWSGGAVGRCLSKAGGF
jgi:hypothetical protein